VSVWLYGGGGIAWTLVGAASGGCIVTFGMIFLLMKKEYRGSFWDTTTGKQQAMHRFEFGDEFTKANVVRKNKKMWAGIREDAKEWVQANWWRWEAEQPSFFTHAWIAKLPLDMIPEDAQQAANEIRESVRRGSAIIAHNSHVVAVAS